MLKKIRKNKFRIAIALLLVFVLALVRIYEHALFYDPFSYYFEADYLNLTFPEYDVFKLWFSMASRYLLNSAISLGIIYVLFQEVSLIKFAAVLYGIFFILLMISFFALITLSGNENNFVIFYIRRFLIQPIFVLLFIPAFYYQRRMVKNNIS